MNTRMRVSAVALPIEIGELDTNLTRIRDAIDATESDGAHLVVFPELATSGYVFDDATEARALSMRADDSRLVALASHVPVGAVAVVGFCEADGDRLFNSALVIGRGSVLGRYRKAHLWDAECDVFTPGSEAGAVFNTPVGRVGVAICYDSEFPELPRRLALAGADVLALPVNWPKVARPSGEHPPETIQAMASARSSRLATVIADRHGAERGVEWTGGTSVISSDGWIRAMPDDRGIATAVLDMSDDKSLGAQNDLFGDRRPELYGVPAGGTIEKRGIHV
jgi:predicted amidohydrolase